MSFDHDTLVGFAKSFGLFYLLALSIAVVVYTYWPSNARHFERAAGAVLADEDKPWR
jgi:cytochrome c oxidase cbb3-type subunit 4